MIRIEINNDLKKELVIEKTRRVLWKSMLKMLEIAQQKSPVALGRLRPSINLQPFTFGADKYLLGDGTEYGFDVEMGTTPHYVSPEKLKLWARRVLGDEKAAYPVSKKIALRGTEAQPFFRPALHQVRNVHLRDFWNEEF